MFVLTILFNPKILKKSNWFVLIQAKKLKPDLKKSFNLAWLKYQRKKNINWWVVRWLHYKIICKGGKQVTIGFTVNLVSNQKLG